jgi:eukaryotic-like serine/threonine-protein kinase
LSKSRFQRLDEAFNHALDLDAGQRGALFERLATTDPDLVARLKAMLKAAERERDPLRASVQQAAANFAPALPETIGPFQVQRQLGIGGMGAVYLCTRSDDDFTQLLAVKRLTNRNVTTLGRDRLVLERRVLARLRHPNIAQLVDGGEDSDGTPYVAMEYIEGTGIDRYAEARGLDRRGRVELFLQLCAAVQFAHQNLVVHRDLKPDNVLVDAHDQVKLLDFGIAKLLGDGESLDATAVPTVAGAMTPHYASPEQVRGEPVSQASDIYSLGMILYELLVGHRPYRLETTRPSEIERIVCTSEPPAPSRALGWRGAAARDLDAIVLKALHKEAARRYASAGQLGEDLQRWLDGMPVLAHPDSRAYRLRTFVRRHPVGTAISLLALVTLTAFAAAMAWQANRVAEQRDVAEREARVATETADFLLDLFAASDPRERNPTELSARDVLNAAAKRLPEAMASDPRSRARMMQVIGLAFANLGDAGKSVDLLKQALALREQVAGPNSAEVSDTLNRLGNVYRQFGQLKEAESMLKRALDWRTHNGPVDAELADSWNNYGLLLSDLDHLDEAETALRRSIELHQQVNGKDDSRIAFPLHNLAIVLRKQNRLAEARTAAMQSLQLKRERDVQIASLALTQGVLAGIEGRMGLLDDALKNAQESLDLRRTTYGNDSPMISTGLTNLANIHLKRGETDAARALYREAVTLHERTHNDDSLLAARARLAYGQFLLATGETAEARAQLQRARTIAAKYLPADSTMLADYDAALAEAEQGRRSAH